MDEQLIKEIQALSPWHHDIEIVPGVSSWEVGAASPHHRELSNPTRVRPAAHFSPLLSRLFPDGLGGRSFLDCACNAGGYSFAARDLGAGRCFAFDARQLWIDQARYVASRRPSEDMAFELMTLEELPQRGLEKFDVTFFGGIFYHLPDPVWGLKIAADLTRDLLIVNTASLPGRGNELRLIWEDAEQPLSGTEPLTWLPTGVGVVQEILHWAGFPHSRVDYQIPLPNGRVRLQIVASRTVEALAAYDAVPPEARVERGTRTPAMPRFVGLAAGWLRRG